MQPATPFFTFRDYLERRYGEKVYKLTVSGGLTCPTRDGTFGPKKGWGGCSFCDAHGSASFYAHSRRELPVRMQLEAASGPVRTRFKADKFLAYFQSYTTTHEELAEFRARWDEAVTFPGVVGLAVGTRPDCLPPEVLDALCSYLDKGDVYLELGVQSLHDATLDWFDRGHDAKTAIDALAMAMEASRKAEADGKGKLDVSAHLILGAPTEPDAALIETAQTLNKLGVHGVKLHHLHVLKKTKLEVRYKKGEFALLSLDDYVQKAALFLRHLDPKIAIHRTHGLAPHPEELVGPDWSTWKLRPKQALEEFMHANGWKQGDLV